MKKILLTTFNARFAHTSIGLRYLLANMGDLRPHTVLREFVLNDQVQDVAEKLLAESPAIIGIGVYIWNAPQVEALVATLKKVSPQTMIVLGGPEVSFDDLRLDVDAADYMIRGEADLAFADLCRKLLAGEKPARIMQAEAVNLDAIELPYRDYSDKDVAHRMIYVEASRGCPFACEFCLSSMDNRVRNLFIDRFLTEMEVLWQRGVRSFKFIDRTFNLNLKVSNRILDFFLAREEAYFLHFEVIPDHFPESLRERISQFPPASLQLEVGIQTLNEDVAARIQRKMKMDKLRENIAFLASTDAHMHLDLIIGLPGESLASFGQGLNQLCALTDSEIQIGILKNLPGTSLSRHDAEWGMVYNAAAPYDILQNDLISFAEIQRMKRFSRFWDLAYNSGNFNRTIRLLWPDGDVYTHFGAFADWLYGQTGSTWKIALDKLAELLFRYLVEEKGHDAEALAFVLVEDILKVEGRRLPTFLKGYRAYVPGLQGSQQAASAANKRQQRHAS